MEWFLTIGLAFNDLHKDLFFVLFVSMCWLVSSSLQTIIDDVGNPSKMFIVATGCRVNHWKKSYSWILNFVQDVDQFSGTYLAVFVTQTCFLIIVGVFNLVLSLCKPDYRPGFLHRSTLNLILAFFKMLIIILATERMKEKARI